MEDDRKLLEMAYKLEDGMKLVAKLATENTMLRSRVEDLEKVLADFLNTQEDPRTWVEEMHGTIKELLQGDDNDN